MISTTMCIVLEEGIEQVLSIQLASFLFNVSHCPNTRKKVRGSGLSFLPIQCMNKDIGLGKS